VLLLAEGFPTELIFFLIVAVISILSRAFEKTKKIRQESVLRQRLKESAERHVLPGMDQVAPTPKTAPTLRERTAAAQLRKIAKRQGASPIAATRSAPPPPPRRTRRQKPHVDRTIDEHFVTTRAAAHPVVARIRKGGRAALQEAILLQEILGPPKAYRQNTARGQRP